MKTVNTFAPDEAHILTRFELNRRKPKRLTSAEFHRLLWVQNGTVRLHANAGPRDLTEGDLLFVTPAQPHGFQAKSEAAYVVSLAIRPDVIAALGARHDDLRGLGFWSDDPTPSITHLDIRRLAELNKSALRLERAPRSLLHLEAFLLPLLASLEAPRNGVPGWLVTACNASANPDVFRQGAAGFVAQTGRSHPHVARAARRYLGQSPSEFVNAQRMAFAAARLTGTSDTLAEIAADCGLPNLSHFHRLFLAAHGETPHAYRRARQRDLLQPAP